MTNFLPSELIHLLEKFQKTVLLCESAVWIPASHAFSKKTVVHGPHGSGAS